MTERPSWGRALFHKVSDNKILSALAVAGATALAGIIWQSVQPTLRTFKDMPAVHDRILVAIEDLREEIRETNERVEKLAGIAPAVVYQDAVRVVPEVGDIGRRIRLVYTARRMKPCNAAQIEDRYFNINDNTFDAPTIQVRRTASFPVSDSFVTHSETLILPPSLSPGDWAYLPVVYCDGQPPIVRPPAYFRIEPGGKAAASPK